MATRRAAGEPGSSQPPATFRVLTGATRQLLAVAEAVDPLLLLEPPQAHELRNGLVHPLAGSTDHARQLLLGDRELEAVTVARQLEQTLGRAPGHVQEDRVGQGLVDRSEPGSEKLDDAPQRRGLLLEGLPHRAVGNGQNRRELERA